MNSHPNMPHRHSIRLKEYDYVQSGAYFVTLCAHQRACLPLVRRAPTTVEQFGKPVSGSVPTIIRSFKSAVTKCINEIRNTPGAYIWQRNYYEHIIRNEADYRNIAEYISNNPQRWTEDSLHPDAPNHPVGARRAVPDSSGHAGQIYQNMLRP